ncbi:LIM domain protein variant [Aphelenchoides avenae]|nr:LIM domain protein variant [Aphelenchus avenae]
MSDTEDPYAVSDSDSDEDVKKPPPKINIEGRSATDFKQIKESLTSEKTETVKDEKRLEEIEELRKAKAEALAKMKKDFEAGTVAHDDDEERPKKEVEKPTGLDKQTLSAFKDRFEKMESTLEKETLDDHLKDLAGVGKENLASMKDMFEKAPGQSFTPEQREALEIQRTEADRKRVLSTFIQPDSDEVPKNCTICDKIVYPVERIIASKLVYHNTCFKCCKCGKKLSPTTFNSHEKKLYCKPHFLDALHPERAGTFAEGDDDAVADDEDDEFAVSSKPKQLSSDIVRAGGTNIGDELSQLKSSLRDKKESWQSSVNEAAKVVERRNIAEEIEAGKVKANKERLATGATGSDEEGANAGDDEKRRDLEEIRAQVSEVKNKWKTGDVEKAEVKDAATKDELEELRKGVNVKERFHEGLQPTEENVTKSYDRSELDTSAIAEARKSFLEGSAYQGGAVEKTATDLQDLKFTGLTSFKDKFERGGGEETEQREKTILELGIQLKNIKESLGKKPEEEDMTPEDRAERKKKEIEAEFLRYKLARQIRQKRAENQEPEDGEGAESSEDKGGLDVEIKLAGKAREKFKNIEAQGGGSVPVPKSNAESRPSKWDKKTESTAEVVNRRQANEDESEDEEEFDVKNLMNKFKNIENVSSSKVDKRSLEELEALRVEAKKLRERFEKANLGETEEQVEEKRRQMEEEFELLKEERQKAKQELEAELAEKEADAQQDKEEVQVAADHASKMAAKWEKIHKKEAKKAEKGKMPQK